MLFKEKESKWTAADISQDPVEPLSHGQYAYTESGVRGEDQAEREAESVTANIGPGEQKEWKV